MILNYILVSLLAISVWHLHKKASLEELMCRLTEIDSKLFYLTEYHKDFNEDSSLYKSFSIAIKASMTCSDKLSFLPILLKLKLSEKYKKQNSSITKEQMENGINHIELFSRDKELKENLLKLKEDIDVTLFGYLFKTSPSFMIFLIFNISKETRIINLKNKKQAYNEVIKRKTIRDMLTTLEIDLENYDFTSC